MYKIIGADQKEYGPISKEVLLQWLAEGRVNGQTIVQAEGGTGWKPLANFPEFGDALRHQASAPAPFSVTPSAVYPGQKTNAMAMTGLIFGIVSITVGLCCCYGLPFNLLGIIFSAIGLNQIKQAPDHEGGRGLAIAGLVLSVLSILFALVIFIFVGAMVWPEMLRDLKKM